MSMPLLTTKLYMPPPGKYLVRRAQLFEKLVQCLEPDCRLALISAPAGFGKTTLVSSWLTSLKTTASDHKSAWLTLDEGDNDPVIFWTYIIAALQTLQEGVGEQALNLLASPGVDFSRKLPSLLNDLAQIRHPCVVVLDDYHLIRSPVIHQSLAFFVEHLPRHIHLMISSRTDPPLPLALMRGRGQLLEIRLSDLRFSDKDAELYLNGGIGLNLESRAVHALNQKTEGWIAGLQMATLAMRDAVSQAGPRAGANFVQSFSGSNRFILDYLIEEVLNRQPEPVQQFLIRTSILDQLCAPLCDALLADDDAAQPGTQSMLEYLESSNLFILPLDDQRYWYRYHQLFADLLHKRLLQAAPEQIPGLHHRAIEWYEQNGLIPSAIDHAFQLEDFRKAAALVVQVAEAMWGRGEYATLLAWMAALPEEEKRRYPNLLTFQVSILISAGRLKEAEACIPILERYIAETLESPAVQQAAPEQAALIGNVSALRTYIASFYGDFPALFANAKTALENLTRDLDAGQRCVVCMVLGNAYLMQGELEAASNALVEAVAAGKKARKPQMVLVGLANQSIVQWFQGSLNRAAQICQEGLDLVEQYHVDRSTMAVDIFLTWGMVKCEQGETSAAEPYLRQGLEIAVEQQYVWQAAWGYQSKARLLLAQGRLADAEAAAQAAEQWIRAHEVPAHISCELAGLQALIWLRMGCTDQVEGYLISRSIQAEGEIHFPHVFEHLALARLRWQQGDVESAARILDRAAGWAEAHQQKRAWIEALILLALVASQSPGKLRAGVEYLKRALELAEPDGYIQIFVSEGEPMTALLREAAERSILPQYTRRLLDVLPLPALNHQPAVETARRPSASQDVITLVEPLSRREMETLQLIAEGLSNKEIAQKMCVSLRTVKYYSTGLYNKLGVDSRMQAVVRARELGLL